jgi:iron complex outermembrane receptor protein
MKTTSVLRRKELAAAISMLLAFPALAIAQDQAADQPAADDDMITEEVIVTGIRRGIMNSVDIKGTSTSIVEAISAEEIGKLPDVSITDSLARLAPQRTQPGAQRSRPRPRLHDRPAERPAAG